MKLAAVRLHPDRVVSRPLGVELARAALAAVLLGAAPRLRAARGRGRASAGCGRAGVAPALADSPRRRRRPEGGEEGARAASGDQDEGSGARRRCVTRALAAISPLLDGYDQLILDLDGCVWVGDEPTPGASEAIAALRDAGKRVAFVTNDPRQSGEDYVRKLWGMGVQASLADVVTVGGAMQHLLAETRTGRTRVRDRDRRRCASTWRTRACSC